MTMPDKYKYQSISLRRSTVSKLNNLAKELIPGLSLSNAKAVEVIIDTVRNSEDTKGISNGKAKI